MKAVPTTANPLQVIPTLLFGNLVTVFGKILTTGIAPSGLLTKGWKREPPNKLLKIKDTNRKVLKMKEPPNNFNKTKGQIGTSQ